MTARRVTKGEKYDPFKQDKIAQQTDGPEPGSTFRALNELETTQNRIQELVNDLENALRPVRRICPIGETCAKDRDISSTNLAERINMRNDIATEIELRLQHLLSEIDI